MTAGFIVLWPGLQSLRCTLTLIQKLPRFKIKLLLDSTMPLVSQFYGIRIYMYWDEHFPEHFHAEYSSFKALVSIQDGVIIKGSLPSKQLKLVLAWCEIHREQLEKNWERARAHGEIEKIDPLT